MHGWVHAAKHDGHRGGAPLLCCCSSEMVVWGLGWCSLLCLLVGWLAMQLLLGAMPCRNAVLPACLVGPAPLLHWPVEALSHPRLLLVAVLILLHAARGAGSSILLGPCLPMLLLLLRRLLMLVLMLLWLDLLGRVADHGLRLSARGLLLAHRHRADCRCLPFELDRHCCPAGVLQLTGLHRGLYTQTRGEYSSGHRHAC